MKGEWTIFIASWSKVSKVKEVSEAAKVVIAAWLSGAALVEVTVEKNQFTGNLYVIGLRNAFEFVPITGPDGKTLEPTNN